VCTHRAAQLDARALSTLASACAVAGAADRDLLEALCRAASAALRQQLAMLQQQQAPPAAQLPARSERKQPHEWQGSCFSPLQLVHLAWALSKLGYADDELFTGEGNSSGGLSQH
jgi:hypothetical protein